MAEFDQALQRTLKNEGGYGNDPQDPGGETYKGIARKMNSKWKGWVIIDMLKKEKSFPQNLDSHAGLQADIRSFYEINYWDKVRGDEIINQDIAESLFDFAVNAGTVASSKLAQITVGAEVDGVIGPKTIDMINKEDPKTFLALFALHKIARYVGICEKRPDSKKFFFGWVRRTLEGI